MINKILSLYPVYFTYVFKDEEDDWVFSWRTADHKRGSTAAYWTEEEAEAARMQWEDRKAYVEHATFVRA